eukprot:12882877-Prorocentrum_lima.AAC.1
MCIRDRRSPVQGAGLCSESVRTIRIHFIIEYLLIKVLYFPFHNSRLFRLQQCKGCKYPCRLRDI